MEIFVPPALFDFGADETFHSSVFDGHEKVEKLKS